MFILAGNVMERGGISGRLIDLARALLARWRGGLPNSLVLAEMFFSGISGSTVADISAMSSMVVPSMEKAGYKRSYALAIVSAASAFGILIPPCILMVVTAALLNSSVIAVFAASVLPTGVFAVLTMGLIYWQAARAPVAPRDGPNLARAAKEASWALGLPVIIVAGIVTGIATATEIAVAAVIYAFAVTILVYKTIAWRDIPELLVETASSTGALCLTFGFATILTYVLAREQVPQAIAEWTLSNFRSPVVLMLVFSLAFLVLGAILEGLPAALILVPVLWPAAESLGITSLHFQIVIIAAIGIGLFLPPFGLGLIIAAQVGQEPVDRITRDFMPFLVVLLIGLAIVAAFPAISNIVPQLLGMQT
jgi:tripartite ATP-independent transporter DctM subunit